MKYFKDAKVGDRVWDYVYGEGEIISVFSKSDKIIDVKFPNTEQVDSLPVIRGYGINGNNNHFEINQRLFYYDNRPIVITQDDLERVRDDDSMTTWGLGFNGLSWGGYHTTFVGECGDKYTRKVRRETEEDTRLDKMCKLHFNQDNSDLPDPQTLKKQPYNLYRVAHPEKGDPTHIAIIETCPECENSTSHVYMHPDGIFFICKECGHAWWLSGKKKTEKPKKWKVEDYFNKQCDTRPSEPYNWTLTCRVCGYTFKHTEDLNYPPSNYKDNVEDVCIEHIMKYHREVTLIEGIKALNRITFPHLSLSNPSPASEPIDIKLFGAEVNMEAVPIYVKEGIEIGKSPWCCCGLTESYVYTVLNQMGDYEQETFEEFEERRKK